MNTSQSESEWGWSWPFGKRTWLLAPQLHILTCANEQMLTYHSLAWLHTTSVTESVTDTRECSLYIQLLHWCLSVFISVVVEWLLWMLGNTLYVTHNNWVPLTVTLRGPWNLPGPCALQGLHLSYTFTALLLLLLSLYTQTFKENVFFCSHLETLTHFFLIQTWKVLVLFPSQQLSLFLLYKMFV